MSAVAARAVVDEVCAALPGAVVAEQATRDRIPTLWTRREDVSRLLRYLGEGVERPFRMLYDLTAIDERLRTHREDQPPADFTVVYHLLSLDRNADVRVKVALSDGDLEIPSITPVFPAAGWYEREVFDMFGVRFTGHPHLRRILMPPTWVGHPLRKEHPARATEMGIFTLPDDKQVAEQEALRFRPEEWGLVGESDESEVMFLNVGPQHPGTHGILRVVLRLSGEEILDAVPEIGYHHRGAEKMAERQTWHTFIPYTDRIDYLAGVQNNLPYVLAVEQLAGIEVPDRVKVIRVMMCELFRVISHLVWYGTFAQDLGAMSPVFYTFNDREHAFDIVAAVTGARMHPGWFRIGGVAQDLPAGWDGMMRSFVTRMRGRVDEYNRAILNRIFKARTSGIGSFSRAEAIEWGVTGPALRACGMAWDWRRARPYSGYERFEFEVPTAEGGDCWARSMVRIEEMRQSLRILQQCIDGMPAGPYKSDHPLATPPIKERTMHDIETLITHFLEVSWGPVIPAGEGMVATEAPKGSNGYYLISDGGNHAYRARIRAPSFAHMQMLPVIARGHAVPDLLAILGAMDYVLADIDR